MKGMWALTVLAALTCGGCDVYDPELLTVVDAAADARSFEPLPCDLRQPPPRPAVVDGADGPEVVFGFKDVVLNQDGDRWRDIGYDLDGRCTEPPSFDAECLPPIRTVMPEVDGNEGIDNLLGHQIYPFVTVIDPELESAARLSEERGAGTIVLILRGWNGEADDPTVDARIFISLIGADGTGQATPPAIAVSPEGPRDPTTGDLLPPPAWTGADWLWAREDGALDGDPEQPVIRDDNAYVADRTLVMRLPARTEIRFQSLEQSVLVRLSDGLFTARFAEDLSRADAIVGGRWALIDILETVERLGVCRGSTQYDIIETQLRRTADLRARPGTGGLDADCDGASVGSLFTGYPTRLAGLVTVSAPPDVCGAMMSK